MERVADQREGDGMTLQRYLTLPTKAVWNAIFWTFERATWEYDLMVIAILAFVWCTPPEWLGDPMAQGQGLMDWILGLLR